MGHKGPGRLAPGQETEGDVRRPQATGAGGHPASHAHRSLLALQRSAGNAAAVKALTGPLPIQRFTRVPVAKQKPGAWAGTGADLRVADDGQMAVEDAPVFTGAKAFFATPGVRGTAQQALTTMGSPLTLEAGTGQLAGTVPGSGKGLRKAKQVTLTEVVPVMQRPNAPQGYGGRGAALKTIEACSAHGLDVMDATSAGGNKAMIDVGGTSIHNTGSSVNSSGATSDIDARDEIMRFVLRKKGELKGVPVDQKLTTTQINRGKELYLGLSKSERRKLARELLINEYASPGVGDGIEALRSGRTAKTKDTDFPMHFAPVVARSGSDYVTLENHARSKTERTGGDTSSASGAWYIRMYGPLKTSWFDDDDDQSYYGQHAEEGSIGGRENLLGLTNRTQAK